MPLPSQRRDESKPHVLIVDDEAELCQTIAISIRQSGFGASTAGSVQEACKLLEQEYFDAIVTDVMMPGEDGIELLGRVRLTQPEIPVILMTGYGQLQMALDAIKKGAFDFIQKPFDFAHLRKVVERAVNYSRLQRMEKNYRFELEETVNKRTAELKQAMCELDFAKSALLKNADEKNNFMSNIMHEMRTPMNGVIGGLSLLENEVTTAGGKEYFEIVRQSADNMLALIDQLLTFGRGTARGGVARYDLISTVAELNKVFAEFRTDFEQKDISLALHVAPDVPSEIWTDKERFKRLFFILLANALKFTKQGGVKFDVSRVISEDEDEFLHFTITDSGIGIPEGMLERIFEPFIQGDGSHTRKYGGLGLGLAIAAQNATILNGRLWAEHVPEGGSRFNFSMKILST